MYHLVYKTVRPETGQFYVGIHSTSDLNDGYQGSGIIVRSMLKAGVHLVTETLCFCESREDAIEIEELMVDERLMADPLCLNLAVGGKGGYITRHYTEQQRMEHKAKISAGLTGKKLSDERKRQMRERMTGTTHSEAVKNKISASNKGKAKSVNHRGKLSDAKRNANPVWKYYDELLILWTNTGKFGHHRFKQIAITNGYPEVAYRTMITQFRKDYRRDNEE